MVALFIFYVATLLHPHLLTAKPMSLLLFQAAPIQAKMFWGTGNEGIPHPTPYRAPANPSDSAGWDLHLQPFP